MSQEREALKLPEGRVVGRYRLHQLQTAWGFYLTYFGEEATTGRQVLLHELLPEELVTRAADGTVQAKDERAKENLAWACERFLREGRGLASCDHPAVRPILDVFEANGTAYWVTPIDEGQSLKRWLEDLGRAPTEAELRALLGPLLSALEQLHGRGLFHLNLKLESIQIGADGKPVLVHFAGARQAIARHSHEAGAATTGYSPIEQYDPDKTEGPWTDIYSLGAVLYRAIYGRVAPEATERVVSDPYQRLAGRVSGEYRGSFLRAIDAALSPAANARPQSIEGWRKMLEVSEPSAPVAPRRNPLLGPAIAAGAALLLAIGAWEIFRPKPVPPYPDPDKKDIVIDERKDAEEEKKKEEEKRKEEEKKLAEDTKKAQEETKEAEKKAAEAAEAEKKAKAAAAQAAEAAAKAGAAQNADGKPATEAAAAEVAAKKAGAERAAAEKTAAEKGLTEKSLGALLAENVAKGKAAAEKAAADAAVAEKAAAEKRAAEQASQKAKEEKTEAEKKVEEKAAAQKEAEKALAAALAAQKELAAKADPGKAQADKAAAEKAAQEMAAKEAAEKAAAEKAAAEKEKNRTAQNQSTPPPSSSGGGGQVGSALGGIWETVEKDGSGAPVKKLLIYADTTYDLISGGKTDTGYVMAKLGVIQLQSVATQTTTNSTFKYKSMRLIETDGALGKFQWERVSPNPPERPKNKTP